MNLTRIELRRLIMEAIRQSEPGYHMSYPHDTKSLGINYTALVLDDLSHQLLAQYAPAGWKIFSHHMTMIAPTHQKGSRIPEYFLNQPAKIVINGIVGDDRVMAGVVDVLASDNLPIKGPAFPHVTICTNPAAGGKPFHSNQLDPSEAEPIDPIVLNGTIQEILR